MMQLSNAPSLFVYRRAALVAGIFSFLMFGAAMMAEFSVRQNLIVPDDAMLSRQNILDHQLGFRLGIACFLLILVCDLLVTWALYRFFERVDQELSLLAALFRLVYTAVFGMALLGLLNGFRLLTAGEQTADVPQRAMEQFRAFDDGWAIGLVFFGLHLLFVGWLILRSGFMPKLLGALLVLASVAYVMDNILKLVAADYASYKTVLTICVALPSMIGELGLAIWLLVKGGKEV